MQALFIYFLANFLISKSLLYNSSIFFPTIIIVAKPHAMLKFVLRKSEKNTL